MLRTAAVIVVLGLSGAVCAVTGTAAAATDDGDGYRAIAAYRALDTRTGVNGNRKGTVNHGQTSRVSLAGHVPDTATAALVSLSTVSPTSNGYLTAFADGTTRPAVYSLVYGKSGTNTTTVLVNLHDARFDVYNGASSGGTQAVVDVLGYYDAAGTVAYGLHEVTPHRITSTTLGAGKTITAKLGGRAGEVNVVPTTVSVVGATKAGSVSILQPGTSQSFASAYYPAGYGSSTLTFPRTDTSGTGTVTVRNNGAASVRIVVDVLGYSIAGPVGTAGGLQVLEPARIVSAQAVSAGKTAEITVAGKAGVPVSDAGPVLVNVTVASPTVAGGIVVGAPGKTSTATRTASFPATQYGGATVISPTDGGKIEVRNASTGSVKIYVDVLGYLPATTVTAPATSRGRYPNDLTGSTSADTARMTALGRADGARKLPFVLLDLGAQSISAPTLSPTHPGVVLANTGTKRIPIGYADLVTDLVAYIQGYAATADGAAASIAVGTNNDGAFDPTDTKNYYAPAERGADWANEVILPVAAKAPSTLSVAGAIDLESGFASDQYQARTWEQNYLAALTRADNSSKLVVNGSADGCPSTYGSSAACAYGWTQAQYVDLNYDAKFSADTTLPSYAGRIQVLPQIYGRAQAVQWANIDRTGHGSLAFAGALTESADAGTYSPAEGWRALDRALSSVRTTVSLPLSVDISKDI